MWTYGDPAFSKDGGKTFISDAAEGKKKSLIFLLLRNKAVYLPRTINRWELNAASEVNSCSVVQALMTVVLRIIFHIILDMLSSSARAFFPHPETKTSQ